MNKWNKVILFGDSLTQKSFEPDNGFWGALLADKLQRISDIIVRGFSGYNSRWCKAILPQLFSEPNETRDVSCFTIFLGANDSNDPQSPTNQFVPIEEYKQNLIDIIDHLEHVSIEKEKLILITPPPYYHEEFIDYCRKNGRQQPIKDNIAVEQYANACISVAQCTGVQVLDVYQAFNNDGRQQQLFCDGLHFSRLGSQFMFQLIWPLIEKRVNNFNNVSDLIMNFPQWTDIDKDNPEKSLI